MAKYFQIDKRTLKYKLFYFIFFFGSSSIRNYLPVYFRSVGMNAVLTGVLTGVRPFTRFVSAPIFSAVADKTGKYKLILMVSLIIAVLSYFSLSFVMIVHQLSQAGSTLPNPGRNHSQSNSSLETKLANNSTEVFGINNGYFNVDTKSNTLHNGSRHKIILSEMAIFWTSLILVMLGDFFTAPVGAIMSATIIYWEGGSKFGKQRVFGALGFGLGSYLSGVAIDRTAGFNYFHSGSPNTKHSDPPTKNYMTAFFIFLGVNVILIILVKSKFELVTERKPKVVFGHLKTLLCDGAVICFLAYVFIMGISGGVIMLFLFWFLEDLGASQALLGLSSAIMSLSEIPVFLLCSKMIKRMGHVGVLFLSLTCFVIRLICYTFLHDPWYVLLIEPLHGLTLATMWSVCISFASIITPPEIYTTMEGVITGVHYGLGWGLGALLGGVFYHLYGPRNLFRGCVVMCCLSFILLAVVYRKVKRDTAGNILFSRFDRLGMSQEQGATVEEYEMVLGGTFA